MPLFRFALGSILLVSASVALGQGSPDRAYPMNVEDRINGVTSGGHVTLDDNERPLNAAGAYPMSTMDRINAARRSRSLAGSPTPSTVRMDATTSGATVATLSLKDRPDAWRYRWHENRWWYYGTDNHWLFWTGNRWNAFQSASAAGNDSSNNGH